MFKLIGAIIMLYLMAMLVMAVVGVLVVVGVIWVVVKLSQVGWRAYESRPEQQVKQARRRVLQPGEVDVRGF